MPVYKNNTEHSISWGALFFDAGEEKTVDVFIPDETGLTQIAAAPLPVSQILMSQQITIAAGESQDIVIPHCRKFGLYVMTENKDIVTIKFGDVNALCGAAFGLSFNGLLWDRNAKFTISSIDGAVVDVAACEEL